MKNADELGQLSNDEIKVNARTETLGMLPRRDHQFRYLKHVS